MRMEISDELAPAYVWPSDAAAALACDRFRWLGNVPPEFRSDAVVAEVQRMAPDVGHVEGRPTSDRALPQVKNLFTGDSREVRQHV